MTLLTLDEVAALGRVSRRTVQREIARGRLEARHVTEGRVFVVEDEAYRWAGLPVPVPPADESRRLDTSTTKGD